MTTTRTGINPFLPFCWISVKSTSHIAVEATGSSAVRGTSVEVSYNKEKLSELWGVTDEVLREADRETTAQTRDLSCLP
jgi:hypothetical protein